jgi:hypothetical protein
VGAMGWWVGGTCCLGVAVSSLRDWEALLSGTMVVDCECCLRYCDCGGVYTGVSRGRTGIICARAGPDLNYSTVYVGDRRHDGGGSAELWDARI